MSTSNTLELKHVNRDFGLIKEAGYMLLNQDFSNSKSYTDLYSFFSELDDLILHDKNFKEAITLIEKDFNRLHSNKHGLSYYAGFNRLHKYNNLNKSHFHYIKSYYSFVKEYAVENLKEYPVYTDFLMQMDCLFTSVQSKLQVLIKSLTPFHPKLRNIFIDGEVEILLKLVRYYPNSEDYVIHKHVDHSAFTCVVNNTDSEESCFFISPEKTLEPLTYKPLKKLPIVFPGKALSMAGIDIPASPHYVIGNHYERYAIIAFCIFPGYDLIFSSP